MGLEKKLQRLEDISNRINGLEGNSLKDNFKKITYLVPVTWLVGSLTGEFQEEYLEKIGFKREHAKYLTIANATIFGLGTSLIWYYGGRETSQHIEKLADFLGVTAGVLNYIYVGANALQNIGRIAYTLRTGKPVISLSFMGIGGTYTKRFLNNFKKKKIKKACEGS